MRKLLTVAFCLFALSTIGNAQITNLPGTGCQNATPTPIGGQPRLNQTLTISATQLPCNSPRTFAFVLLNACTHLPNLNFACASRANPCTMLFPFELVALRNITASVQLPIPNARQLIGLQFCVQGGCFSLFGGFCVFPLNQIAQIKIQA